MEIKDTELILSNSCTGFKGVLNIEENYKVAQSLGLKGLELIPFKYTQPEKLLDLSEKYDIDIKGLHLPLWWETKSLSKVLAAEVDIKEKAYQILWNVIIGPGKMNCSALKISEEFENAYLLSHPDTYHQIPNSLKDNLLRKRNFFFENERAKKIYFSELREGKDTHDPYSIKNRLLPSIKLLGLKGKLMFDPRHTQIAQNRELIPKKPLYEIWDELKPEGLHFSFYDKYKGEGHNLPVESQWKDFSYAIKQNPPEYIVIEMASIPDAEKSREIIGKDLGI